MKTFAQQRASAAKWIYQRKDRVGWWRWTVLTEHNSTDPASQKLDERTAFLIFSDLVHDGLLVPVVADDGGEAYSINPGKDQQWQEAASPWRWWLRHNTFHVIEWFVSGFIGAVIGIGVTWWWIRLAGE